jgi:hypothetical protein
LRRTLKAICGACQVHEQSGVTALHWVRAETRPAGGATRDLNVELLLVPRAGPAACWSVTQGVAPSQALCDEPLDAVKCGEPFSLDIAAHDEHGNR